MLANAARPTSCPVRHPHRYDGDVFHADGLYNSPIICAENRRVQAQQILSAAYWKPNDPFLGAPILKSSKPKMARPGLAAAAANRPDLILMDIQLPGLDGYEATRRIKADAVYP